MTIRGKAFSGTPVDAALMNPWVTPPPLNERGVILGIDLRTGRVIYFDPWDLKSRELITGLIFLALGERNAGKSSLFIMLVMRLMTRQAGVIDGVPQQMTTRMTTRKALETEEGEGGSVEFKPMNDHLSGIFLDLQSAGGINIFDPRMGMTEFDILETAINICELANNDQPLRNFQPLVLQVAVNKMLRSYGKVASPDVLELVARGLDLTDVSDYFKASNSRALNHFTTALGQQPELAEQLKLETERPANIPAADFERDKMYVSQQLGRVLRGDFGQIFGGEKSLYDVLSQPMVTISMAGLNLKARSLFESMLWKWATTAQLRGDHQLIPGINGADEEHEGLTSLMYTRFWASSVQKARAVRTFDMRAMQYLRQLTEAGSADSEIRALARQIALGVGAYFIGRQPLNDPTVLDEITNLGVSDLNAEFTTQLRTGQFMLKVPGHPGVFFQAQLTPTELRLAKTNQSTDAMNTFVPALTHETLRWREQRYGSVELGALLHETV
jgi:hypothetical protein